VNEGFLAEEKARENEKDRKRERTRARANLIWTKYHYALLHDFPRARRGEENHPKPKRERPRQRGISQALAYNEDNNKKENAMTQMQHNFPPACDTRGRQRTSFQQEARNRTIISRKDRNARTDC